MSSPFIYSRMSFSRYRYPVQGYPKYPAGMQWVKSFSTVPKFQHTAIVRANLIIAKRVWLVCILSDIYKIDIPGSSNPLKATWNLLCRWMKANYPDVYNNPAHVFEFVRQNHLLQQLNWPKYKMHLDLVDMWDDLNLTLTPILDLPELIIESDLEKSMVTITHRHHKEQQNSDPW